MRLICFLIALFLGFYAQAQNFKNVLVVPKAGELSDIAMIRPRPGGVVQLKPAIDLSGLLPTPGMQGYTQGSCAAWSVGYGLMTYLKFRRERWQLMSGRKIVDAHVYSPSLLYNQLTIDPDCEKGIYIKEALEYSRDVGSLPLSLFSYDPNTCSRKIKPGEQRRAADVRLLSFNKIFDGFEPPFGGFIDPTVVKAQLNDSLVVPIGVHLDKSFIYEYYGDRRPGARRPYIWDNFLNDTQIDTAYHAMLCVGYNDTLRAFKVMNSWDVTFGDAGFVWIAEPVFQAVVKEAYTAVLPPPRAHLVPLKKKEEINLEQNENFSFDMITDTNWIKKKYYREYYDIRIGCLDLNESLGTAVIKLTDIKNDKMIATANLKIGDEYQGYEYKGRLIEIKLVKIDKAGKNPFKKAPFYGLRYTNLSGTRFDLN